MNYKKGLFRIWLVSLPVVFGWTYLSEVQKSTPVLMMWYGYHQDAKIELYKPECREIVSQNPEKFPTIASPNPCINLTIFWRELREMKQGEIVSEKDIDAIYEKNWSGYPAKQGLITASLAMIGYHIFLLLVAGVFIVIRWIIKGFRK